MFDGGDGALAVVRPGDRRVEFRHLGAGYEHHGLPGLAKPLQVACADGRRNRNDAVDLRPRNLGGEVTRLASFIAGRGGLKSLNYNETPASAGNLPGNACEEISEEVPAEARSEYQRL